MASQLSAGDLRAAILASLDDLRRARAAIDGANVYPVPDADTGTNLVMTFEAVQRALADAGNDDGAIAGAIAAGALTGARGNSGIIMAQILRGWAEAVASGPARPKEVAAGFRRATDLAYDSVLAPADGTILSVLRAAAEATAGSYRSVSDQLAAAARAGAEALERTPEQMSVLAQNGVVDAGGMGLVTVLTALARTVGGEVPAYEPPAPEGETAAARCAAHAGTGDQRYEVMYMLKAREGDIPALRQLLGTVGDSVAVIGGAGSWRVHVHTNEPGRARELGEAIGDVRDVEEVDLRAAPTPGDVGARGIALAPATTSILVAAVEGDGARRLFSELGARVVDRTTAAIVAAVDAAGDAGVIVLPNDEELFAGAASALGSRDGRVSVMRTADEGQGLAVAVAYADGRSPEDNVREMQAVLDRVRSGQVTLAPIALDTDAGHAAPGDAVGFVEGAAIAVDPDPTAVILAVAQALLSGASEVLTVLAGASVDASERERVTATLTQRLPGIAVEVHDAGQAAHRYVLAVE